MAGLYPDMASWRMPYDVDGTALVEVAGNGGVKDIPVSDVQKLAGETGDATYRFASGGLEWPGDNVKSSMLAFIFPELRDIDGIFVAIGSYSGNGVGTIEVSPNSTNGLDGTWTSYKAGYAPPTTVLPWRTAIQWGTALDVKAVRILVRGAAIQGAIPKAVHIYGEISPGTTDRLDLWHPTADAKLPPAWLDWGDVPRSSSAQTSFRVKNLSGTKTAGNARVSTTVLTDTTPSVPAQHLFSLDGVNFSAQVNVGSLGPGAVSAPVYIRRVTPSNAVLGLWAFRVRAQADTFA